MATLLGYGQSFARALRGVGSAYAWREASGGPSRNGAHPAPGGARRTARPTGSDTDADHPRGPSSTA